MSTTQDLAAIDYLKNNSTVVAVFKGEDAIDDERMSDEHWRRRIDVPDINTRKRIALGLQQTVGHSVADEIIGEMEARGWKLSFPLSNNEHRRTPLDWTLGISLIISAVVAFVSLNYVPRFEFAMIVFAVLFFGLVVAFNHIEQRMKLKARELRNAQLAAQNEPVGEDEPEVDGGASVPGVEKEPMRSSKKANIFIVHGHDDGAKHEVARFIADVGHNPMILHEMASGGSRTIIEKLERYADDADFAVVLLTPDDVGGPATGGPDPKQKRARQNVILELGYFMAKLSRERVCALYKDVELPTDYAGVLYVSMDPHGAWKQSLAREIKSAGFDVDLSGSFLR